MTNSNQFKRFNHALTSGRPDYDPWYILLGIGDKDPSSTKRKWKHPDSRLTPEKAVEMIKYGMNIGLAGTDQDMLVIIDVDDESAIPESKIKPTLSTRSRSRIGTHNFYFATDENAKINIPTEGVGEVRSIWQYVVVPGSYVTCSQSEIDAMDPSQRERAGQYTIEKEIVARSISYNEFPSIFRHHIKNLKEQKEREPDKRSQFNTSGPKSALFDLSLTDVLGPHPTNERFPSLFHGSKTGTNTSISDNQIHCFRHNCSLTPLRALAVLAGLYDCMQAGISHKHANAGDSDVNLTDGKTVFALWKYAKENNMIPIDDPIPTVGLTWYCITTGLCTILDLENGWRLPHDIYCKGKDSLVAANLLSRPKRTICSHASPNPECGRKV